MPYQILLLATALTAPPISTELRTRRTPINKVGVVAGIKPRGDSINKAAVRHALHNKPVLMKYDSDTGEFKPISKVHFAHVPNDWVGRSSPIPIEDAEDGNGHSSGNDSDS